MTRVLLASILLAACQARTEIVIGFATDYTAPVPLDEIKLEVIRQDGFPEGGDGLTWTLSGTEAQPYNLPASYGVYSDDKDVQLDVTLSGMTNGATVVSQTVTLSLVTGQTLFYRMGLTGACAGMEQACGSNTCIEGSCVSARVDSAQLPTFEPRLVTTLTCIPPHTTYLQTANGEPMPFSPDAASCPPELCVQGLCLKPPGKSTSSPASYLKPGFGSPGAQYGDFNSLAMSSDGNTIVVGAELDSLGGQGVNPDESSPVQQGQNGGAYVFSRAGTGSPWTVQAYLKASNDEMGDGFGAGVAISADGSTIAIGATGEASAATGVGANQSDNTKQGAGAVYIFTRSGSTWAQTAYIKPSTTTPNAFFGRAVALSSDGTTLAVGEYRDDSSTTGIDSIPDLNGAANGSVFVFRNMGAWVQEAYIKPAITHDDDEFGLSVALSATGNTLAVGAVYESSSATGVGGDASLTNAPNSGAAYIFTRVGSTWSQQTYIKASNTQPAAGFGDAVSLSAAGDVLVVGAPSETSGATGINGNQSDTSAPKAGAAYVFTFDGTAWSQQAYVKASNTVAQGNFGIAVNVAPDGKSFAVGAFGDSSSATGIGGNQQDAGAMQSGAAYWFSLSGSTVAQTAYVKASNTRAMAKFGSSLAMSFNGTVHAIGAPGDSSGATGVNGDQTNTSAANTGAVYVYPP